jgi:hypothetical protein
VRELVHLARLAGDVVRGLGVERVLDLRLGARVEVADLVGDAPDAGDAERPLDAAVDGGRRRRGLAEVDVGAELAALLAVLGVEGVPDERGRVGVLAAERAGPRPVNPPDA